MLNNNLTRRLPGESSDEVRLLEYNRGKVRTENSQATLERLMRAIEKQIVCLINCHPRAEEAKKLFLKTARHFLQHPPDVPVPELPINKLTALVAQSAKAVLERKQPLTLGTLSGEVDAQLMQQLASRQKSLDLNDPNVQETIDDFVGRIALSLSW